MVEFEEREERAGEIGGRKGWEGKREEGNEGSGLFGQRDVVLPKLEFFVPTVAAERKVVLGIVVTKFVEKVEGEAQGFLPTGDAEIGLAGGFQCPKHVFIVLAAFLEIL